MYLLTIARTGLDATPQSIIVTLWFVDNIIQQHVIGNNDSLLKSLD